MEIKTLIGESADQVQNGVELVGQSGGALSAVVGQVSHISELITGIARAAEDQSTGLHEINIGVSQLDAVTQQNAAMVEQSSAASHLLKNEAAKLTDLVAHFDIEPRPTGEFLMFEIEPPPPNTSEVPTGSPSEKIAKVAADGGSREWQDF